MNSVSYDLWLLLILIISYNTIRVRLAFKEVPFDWYDILYGIFLLTMIIAGIIVLTHVLT